MDFNLAMAQLLDCTLGTIIHKRGKLSNTAWAKTLSALPNSCVYIIQVLVKAVLNLKKLCSNFIDCCFSLSNDCVCILLLSQGCAWSPRREAEVGTGRGTSGDKGGWRGAWACKEKGAQD